MRTMRGMFHVFEEFAKDVYDTRYFHVDTRRRFLLRLLQTFIPIGLWVILVLEANDLVIYTAPYLAPLFGTTWALSIIGGPIVAIALYSIYKVPLDEPIPTPMLLAIEFSGDTIFFILWLIETLMIVGILLKNNLACPFISHLATPTYYATGQEPVPRKNESAVYLFVANSPTTISVPSFVATYTTITTTTTTTTTSSHTSKQSAVPTASTAATIAQVQATLKNIFHQTSSTTATLPPIQQEQYIIRIVQSQECYPILQNLVILTSVMTVLFLASFALDIYAYLKGSRWDALDFTDRTRAETMANLRRVDTYGVKGGIGIQQGEFARSRAGSQIRASRSATVGATSERYGGNAAGRSLAKSQSFGSLVNLTAASEKNISQGPFSKNTILAGISGGGGGIKKSGSNLALNSSTYYDRENTKNVSRNNSFSMKGPGSCVGKVDAEYLNGSGGGGLNSALKDFSSRSACPSVTGKGSAPVSRTGSVSSLFKKSGK